MTSDSPGADDAVPDPRILQASIVMIATGLAVLAAGVAAAWMRTEDDPTSPTLGVEASGTITAIDPPASTLRVTTSSGTTVDVRTTADTSISETVEGSAGDLAPGDTVLVFGAGAQIIVGDTALLGFAWDPGLTTGTVTAVDDGSITLRTADGDPVAVTISAATDVLWSVDLPLDDLAPGDAVTVLGLVDEGGRGVTAASILRGNAGGQRVPSAA